jgi:ferritin-like metal-binding protein YciE
MEIQARELMERQSERLTEYPDLRSKLAAHLKETHSQLERLEEILKRLNESPSTLKDTAQSFVANIMAMGHAMAGDEVLKNTFANNAFENFEIAAYRSLLTMAEAAGAGDAMTPLRASLAEEERMAEWVADNVESITKVYINQQRRAA